MLKLLVPNLVGGVVSPYLAVTFDSQKGKPNSDRLCHIRGSNKVRNDMAIRSNRVI